MSAPDVGHDAFKPTSDGRVPRLVIVGRPNVGKSTLFNRLLGRRRALVHDAPGVTRDRIEEVAEWVARGHRFRIALVDTGGVGGERFDAEIRAQVALALESAGVALVIFDGQAGLLESDREVMRLLRASGLMDRMPVIGVVNKVDAEVHESAIAEFHALGLEPLVTVSAEHGRGIHDLQDLVADAVGIAADGQVPEKETVDEERRTPRVAIVGKPNAGKSTLLNALLGQERMIVSDIAGTTVDAVDSRVVLAGREYVFVDTAGIRRKSSTEKGIEVLSVVQARGALERADVAILLMDGELGISDQDEKIGGLIQEAGCSVVVALNKWDMNRGRDFPREEAAKRVRAQMAYLNYAPLIFLSAKRRQGIDEIPKIIDEVLEQRRLRIPTHELTEFIRREAEVHNPKNARFYFCQQMGRRPPTMVCHVNDARKIPFSLERHLVNAIRARWGFMGTPIRMKFVEAEGRARKPGA